MADENETDQTDDSSTDTGGTGDGSGSGTGAGEKTLTQTQVDALVKREKSGAERRARQALADELGISIDEAKALIASKREQDEAQKTEAQRATDAANAAKAQADAAVARARQSELKAELKAALLGGSDDEAPIRRERVELALSTILPRLAGVDDAGMADAVAEAVAAFRGEVPEFFVTAGSNGSGSNGNGSGTPPGPGRKLNERAGDGAGQKSRAEIEFEARKARGAMRPLPRP